MNKHLHIISFTVPYPPNYGGVVDLFWKLPALQKAGIQIHLHCFEYGQNLQTELNKYCASVHYYKRLVGLNGLSFTLPYIVASRKNEELFLKLLEDDYPILLEGIHSTYLLNDNRFENRKIIVRLHNIECNYYKHLANNSNNLLNKLYYLAEHLLLKKYEKKLATTKAIFLTVTEKDKSTFIHQFGYKNINYLPLFLPESWKFNLATTKNSYCLYQADLSVVNNEKAAIWLLEKVFNTIDFPLIVAGKNPSLKLIQIVKKYKHVTLNANPNNEVMQQLISHAQINILPSLSNTGIKLKLLNALYNGKYCLVNSNTIDGTEFESLCIVANNVEEMQQKIKELFCMSFNEPEIIKRKTVLDKIYNNTQNAEQLIKYIFDES